MGWHQLEQKNLIGLNPSLTISNYFGIDISFYKINVSLPGVEFLAFVAKSKPFHLKGSNRDEPDTVLFLLKMNSADWRTWSTTFIP